MGQRAACPSSSAMPRHPGTAVPARLLREGIHLLLPQPACLSSHKCCSSHNCRSSHKPLRRALHRQLCTAPPRLTLLPPPALQATPGLSACFAAAWQRTCARPTSSETPPRPRPLRAAGRAQVYHVVCSAVHSRRPVHTQGQCGVQDTGRDGRWQPRPVLARLTQRDEEVCDSHVGCPLPALNPKALGAGEQLTIFWV